MSVPPQLGFHGSDFSAFEEDMTARAQQRFNHRRQRKLIARRGKNPFGTHRTPYHADIMASEDWPLANIPDGIQDSFEVRPLVSLSLPFTSTAHLRCDQVLLADLNSGPRFSNSGTDTSLAPQGVPSLTLIPACSFRECNSLTPL